MEKNLIIEAAQSEPEIRNYCSNKQITILPTTGSPMELMTMYFTYKPFAVVVGEDERYSEVYKAISDAGLTPRFIAIACNYSDESPCPSIRRVRKYDTRELFALLDEMLEDQISKSEGFKREFDDYAENYIYKILGQLGFRLKCEGTRYIHDVLKMMYMGEFGSSTLVTKDIYPSIAKRYNTTPGAIERNIRTAIVHYWDNKKSFKYLGEVALPLAENNITPGNKETLKYISSRITLDLNAKKNEMKKAMLCG